MKIAKTIQDIVRITTLIVTFIWIWSQPGHAAMVTETWQGTVVQSHGAIDPYYSVGDVVRWSVTYEDTSTQMNRYNDGVNGIGELGQGDDTLNRTYSDLPGYTVMSDAIFNFGNIFNNLDSDRPAENPLATSFDTNMSAYAIGTEVQQWYEVDHLQFGMRNAVAQFHIFALDASRDNQSYSHFINLENLSIVPIPTSLPLLGGGLGLLFFFGRRNASQAHRTSRDR